MKSLSFSLALSLAILAGCDSGDPVTPQVDVDVTLNQMATNGISSYSDMVSGVPVSTAFPGASSCGYDAPSAFFICPPVTASGLTFSRRFQLLDASGQPLSTKDPLRMASVRSVVDIEGTTTTTEPDPVTMTLDRHEDATLSGVQSVNRVLQSNATQALSLTRGGTSTAMNDTSVTTDLRLPATVAQKYPLAGSIVTNGTMAYDSDGATGSSHYRTELSFDGTSVVTLKATYGSETIVCKIDLGPSGKSSCS